ncbi:hypothetical protein HK15_05815 [Acetobacter orientalis]|uniref:Uncharacterized protein n=1 Tax=Acetobacter orientalis TaxID=146474 RepID=A0A252BDX4_9PROT|nr:hypothetical protein HK15_05815 [Acetobacter orientalis]
MVAQARFFLTAYREYGAHRLLLLWKCLARMCKKRHSLWRECPVLSIDPALGRSHYYKLEKAVWHKGRDACAARA